MKTRLFVSMPRLVSRHFITLACVGILAAFLLGGCSNNESGTNGNSEKAPVVVMTVKRGTLSQSLTYNGDVKAESEVKVFSRVPDRIVELTVDVGSRVRIGDLIARIEASALEQAVRQAEAGLAASRVQEANLRVDYERAQRLLKENALSQQQFDAIKTQAEAMHAQVEQAQAALEAAKSMYADARVTAPISGIIATRNLDEGDMASPGVPLVTIVQMSRVKTTFDAIEIDLRWLSLGQAATVRVRSYPDHAFAGRVTRISPVLDPATRMASVEVIIDNPKHLLKPGMFATVEVLTGAIDSVITVPRHAAIEHTVTVNREGTEEVVKDFSVFVVTNGVAEQRALKIQYANHRALAVSSGLAVGEQVVTLGQKSLRNGSPVTIVREEEWR